MYGRSEQAPLYEQLHEKQIGGLAASPIVVAPLFFAQEMTGVGLAVSRGSSCSPRPGAEDRVRAALVRLAAGRLNVEGTSYDEQLFAKAASASNQSTALFAVISALVGFLFAFNAMLLTRPAAPAADRGAAPRRLHAARRHRRPAARRDRARPGRMRARAGARRGALDPPVPRQPRLPRLGVRGRHPARRRLAERRDRGRRRDARGDRSRC